MPPAVSLARWCVALVCSTLALMSIAVSPSAAQDVSESVLTSFAQRSAGDAFEAEMRFVGTPRSRAIVLAEPNRIALDLFDTVTATKTLSVRPTDVVSGLRAGLVAADRYRLVFDLKHPALPEIVIANENGRSSLVLRIKRADPATFQQATASRGPLAASLVAAAPPSAVTEPTYTVVIDPGHGGVDTGAKGRKGTLEKNVNLKFAEALRDALRADARIKVLMTREDDSFVSLTERSDIARRAKANLFISMHSDSIRYSDLRGATVYTLSEKASDSLAGDIAESENSADRFVDPQWRENKPEVFDILVELMRRETESLSDHFAAGLVQELGRHDIRLIRNPKRSAGFKVLTAPDVPSVLLEVGYLSNVEDEQLLLDESWRKDSAAAIAAAVTRFLRVELADQVAGER